MEVGHEVWAFEGQHLASVLGTHYCLACHAVNGGPIACTCCHGEHCPALFSLPS